MGWLLRLVTGGPTGGRGPPIVLEFLVINFRGRDLRKWRGPRMVALRLWFLSNMHYTAIISFFLTFVGRDLMSVKRKDGNCADNSAISTISTTGRILSLTLEVEDSSVNHRYSNSYCCCCCNSSRHFSEYARLRVAPNSATRLLRCSDIPCAGDSHLAFELSTRRCVRQIQEGRRRRWPRGRASVGATCKQFLWNSLAVYVNF